MAKKRGASGQTFEIRTVADFLLVPEHRLGKCLREFRMMLDMTRAMDALFQAAAKVQGIPPEDARIALVPCFEWIDDDKGNISMEIRTEAAAVATQSVVEAAPRTEGET